MPKPDYRIGSVSAWAAMVLAMAPFSPAKTLVVDQNQTGAADTNAGTVSAPFKTINAAARVAVAGDTIVVHAGIYRECIVPANGGEEGKPITYTAAPDEVVCVRGSDVFAPAWETVAGQPGVYQAPVDADVFKTRLDGVPGKKTLGQVMVDDQMLQQMDDAGDLNRVAGSWMTDGTSITVHCPAGVDELSKHQVQITVRRNCFRPEKRGLGYLVIRGFRFEHAANQGIGQFWTGESHLQSGLVSCRSGNHWVIENNSIRWANSIGLDIGMEKHIGQSVDGQPQPELVGWHLIRNNTISDNGEGGICGIGHVGVKIIGNVLKHNNRLGFNTFEEAAIKVHFALETLIEGNVISDNETGGIWLDNTWQDVRITRNVICNNRKWGGIFCELGRGPCLVDNNVIALTRGDGPESAGFYSHDAAGVTLAHNLFIMNEHYGAFITRATERRYASLPRGTQQITRGGGRGNAMTNEVRDMKVVNNLFIDNGRAALNFPAMSAPDRNNVSDYNVYTTAWLLYVMLVANNSAGTNATAREAQAALDRAVAEEDIQAEDMPKVIKYQGGILLTLDQWQLLSKQDLHSGIARLSRQAIHTQDEPYLTFRLNNDVPFKLGCRPVQGVDKDFYGNPLPAENPLPGPFQNLKAGANLLRLWPAVPAR